jgi:hypothetical protein
VRLVGTSSTGLSPCEPSWAWRSPRASGNHPHVVTPPKLLVNSLDGSRAQGQNSPICGAPEERLARIRQDKERRSMMKKRLLIPVALVALGTLGTTTWRTHSAVLAYTVPRQETSPPISSCHRSTMTCVCTPSTSEPKWGRLLSSHTVLACFSIGAGPKWSISSGSISTIFCMCVFPITSSNGHRCWTLMGTSCHGGCARTATAGGVVCRRMAPTHANQVLRSEGPRMVGYVSCDCVEGECHSSRFTAPKLARSVAPYLDHFTRRSGCSEK